MKKYIVIIFMVLIVSGLKAGESSELFYFGHTYYEDAEGKQVMIPFAVVKLCEFNNPNNVVAIRISGALGQFRIYDVDVEQDYVLKVYAPNVKEQWFRVHPNNGKYKTGNLNIDTKLDLPEYYLDMKIPSQKFIPSDFDKKNKIEEMITQLPMIENMNGDFVSKGGGVVRLWFNGGETDMQTYEKLKNFRAKNIVEYMEYFDLSETENPIYDGVLNIMLKIGDRAELPSWRLVSMNKVERK